MINRLRSNFHFLKKLRAYQVDSIISDFLWPQLLNQDHEWPESSISAVTLATANIISDFIETLFPLIPRPCDKANLSKAPGDYVLALAHVSKYIQTLREERTAAAYLAGLSLEQKEHQKIVFKGVPRPFTVFPIPSLKWRHITLNTKALCAVSGSRTTSGHQNDQAKFNHFFQMEEYGYARYIIDSSRRKIYIDLTFSLVQDNRQANVQKCCNYRWLQH